MQLAEPLGYPVHYTTDGSAPTQASPTFATPLDVKLPATVRAAAFADGRALAPVSTFELTQASLLSRTDEAMSVCPDAGRLLLRLIEPSAGSIVHEGTELTALDARQMRERRRHMQIIFQDPYASLNPRMTVGQTLAEPLQLHGLHTGRHAERVAIAVIGDGNPRPGRLFSPVQG